jgi:phosphoenolpyruvate carboxylase
LFQYLNLQDSNDIETLREMYNEWPWFRETLDLIAMIVSKTDFSISKNYDTQLVDAERQTLGEEVREKLVQTRRALSEITQTNDVAGVHVALQRASSQIRAPYVDPLNVMQAELLKRLRALEKQEEAGDLSPDQQDELQVLKDALIVSINGIAQGMKNSG